MACFISIVACHEHLPCADATAPVAQPCYPATESNCNSYAPLAWSRALDVPSTGTAYGAIGGAMETHGDLWYW